MSSKHVAILGAGPTGLDAALAAVDAGAPFTLYEAAPEVAAHVRSWGHVRLFSPWSMNVSPRIRRHLTAAGHALPAADEPSCPTGAELVETVLAPVAELPAVAPNLASGVRVREVGRQGLVKDDEIGTGRRAEHRFRLLVEDSSGRESIAKADVVLDCTGTWGHPNSLGDGGIAAPGERALAHAITRQLVDFESQVERWAGKLLLLVGAGHSAQTAAVDLALFSAAHPGTRVLWALRHDPPNWRSLPDDPLPERVRLTAEARRLAAGGSAAIETVAGVVVESLAEHDGRIAVTLRRADGTTTAVVVDHVLSLTGSVGDHTLYRQLQVHECYATSGPMNLSAALLGSASEDCLAQTTQGLETLANPEPHFFLLGSKSYGRNATFLMRAGWEQIDAVFGPDGPFAASSAA